MLYCDRSNQISTWSSEELHIPYRFEDKWHNYYPDFLVETDGGKMILVEIKPEHQWNWYINKAKWKAAEQYCDFHGYTFKVLGKKQLYGR